MSKIINSFILGFCKCGCNKEIKDIISKHRKTLKLFLHGHNRYINDGTKRYKSIRVNGRTKLLHRYIVEKNIKRKLDRKEIIHHIDKNIFNNDISNLQILNGQAEHNKIHKPRRKHYNRLDFTKRFCYICNSNKSFIDNRGYHVWYNYKNNKICSNCYQKINRSNDASQMNINYNEEF